MEQSPRLSLSYVQPAQAQKHVTVNETFRRLDALTQLTVSSRTITAEPGAPSEGDAYILPESATGAVWGGFTPGNVAAFQDGAWVEITALEGFRAWVSDTNELAAFDGTGWAQISGGGSETAAKFGVNATADTTNRLSVKSDAVLFSHDDVTPGNDDCIIIVNKKAVGDTASHMFQTGFSGRAEFGLTGDDGFHIKVSADGASWIDAMVIDKDTGSFGLGTNSPVSLFHIASSGGDPNSALYTSDIVNISAEETAPGFNLIAAGSAAAHRGVFKATRARGTLGSPTAAQDNDKIFSLLGVTYDGTSGKANVGIAFEVDGTVSTGVVPTRIEFETGTTSRTTRMKIESDGSVVVGNPTGGGKGVGTINAKAVYDDNTLLTCYVFDQALDGAIDNQKWDDKVPDRLRPAEFEELIDRDSGKITNVKIRDEEIEQRSHLPMRQFTARIGGEYDPLTLDGYARHWREKRHLTAMPNEMTFDPAEGLPAGAWIQRLVETVEIQAVLIEELNQRTKKPGEGDQNERRV